MVFSSLEFIFAFLPIFFAVYYIVPFRFKNVWLLAGSLGFYFWGVRDTPAHFVLLCAGVVVTYAAGIQIGKSKNPKAWLKFGLIYNFAFLFIFKYAGFFLRSLGGIFGQEWNIRDPVLPLGISFFTFQAASYIIDVYNGRLRPERSLVKAGAYLSMFPQLIAGPIVTYGTVKNDMDSRKARLAMVDRGLREFTIGLGLKVLLANRIGKLWTDAATIGYESISTPLAWMAIAAYSFQIYLDFYGYSRMAVGLGMMLGFKFPRNFNYPYTARSMTQFWRQWHMTLSQWFRDYLYIPLGGSRSGKLKTLRNLLIVWLCTGLWHGADWNFILWGLILFILLCIEKAGLKKLLDKSKIVSRVYMLLAIPLTWLVFALPDLTKIRVFLGRLFPFGASTQGAFAGDFIKYGKMYGVYLIICAIFCTPIPRRIYKKIESKPWSAFILLAILIACIYCLFMGMDDPFLYFRF